MDNQKTLFLIVGVLVVGLVFGAAFTGQATKYGKSCHDRDSDGYFAQSGCGTSLDCNDDNPSIHPNAVEICANGIDENCNGIDEACTTVSTSTTPPITCYDSDNGQDIYIKGTVTYQGSGYTDYCYSVNLSGQLVGEYFCNSNGIAQVALISCPSGYFCTDGACRLA